MEEEQFDTLIEELRRIADNLEIIAQQGISIYTDSNFPIAVDASKGMIYVKIEDIVCVEGSIQNME